MELRTKNAILLLGLALGIHALADRALAQMGNVASRSAPKLRVVVEPTADRWITFGDGVRLQHGWEITPLLEQALFEHGGFSVLSPLRNQGLTRQSVGYDEALLEERLGEQVSKSILAQQVAHGNLGLTQQSASRLVHARVRARVETLIYSSGLRSNRVVMGFSPDRLDPFNAGMPGALDNEFIFAQSSRAQVCGSRDFFQGQAQAAGFGPWRGNFGANFDEGFEIFVAGYGFGFRIKRHSIRSEIAFDVEYPELSERTTIRLALDGRGRDLMLTGSYHGISAEIEIQRRKTLRQALQQMLPQLAKALATRLAEAPWSTFIVDSYGSKAFIEGGVADGLFEGMTLMTETGVPLMVVQVGNGISRVQATRGEMLSPRARVFAGETRPLRLSQLSQSSVKLDPLQLSNAMDEHTAKQAVQSVEGCPPPRRLSFWERSLQSLFFAYGLFRYLNVLDQSFSEATSVQAIKTSSELNSAHQLAAAWPASELVAFVSSGISPRESRLRGVLEPSGFDFFSWDNRPSDDLGVGTAEAVRFAERTGGRFRLLPIRIIGPFGNTHSSAIYQAFKHLADRKDVSHVVVPLAPDFQSEAFRLGVQMVSESGKTVFVSTQLLGVGGERVVSLPPGEKSWEHGVFGTRGRVSRVGLGVVDGAAEWLKQRKLK